MVRKLVLSIFILALTCGTQSTFAKMKFSKRSERSSYPSYENQIKEYIRRSNCAEKKRAKTNNKKCKRSENKAEKSVRISKKIKKQNLNKNKCKKSENKIKKPIEICKEDNKVGCDEKNIKHKIKEKDKKSWWSGIFSWKRKSSKKDNRLSKEEKLIARREKRDKKKLIRSELRNDKERREREADFHRKLRREKLDAEKDMHSKVRSEEMEKWKKIRLIEIKRDYRDGLYADLYKRPAWPFNMLFADNKNLMQIVAGFEHATNFYDSKGSSHDLSASVFGEKEFYFRDILLALELNKRTVGGVPVLTHVDGHYPWKHLEDYLFDKKLIFFSEENKLDLNFNYGRYIKDRDIFIGFELPVAYKQRRLKFDSDVKPGHDPALINGLDIYLRTFLREDFEYLLDPKNLIYQPKSSVIGIGDFAAFINFNIQTKYLEMFKLGGKIVWPTAKEADTHKLWPVELGIGATQFKIFSSVMFNKQNTNFNPHMFLEATYVWVGHKNKRVPRVITFDGNSNQPVGSDVMAHGDRVLYNNIAFKEPDTKIVEFADNVKSVKIRQGAQFNFRLGNIWEKLIARRGFLDVYYDFRAKIKDRVLNSGLDSTWLIHRLEENTMQLEHKVGFDFSYQYDIHSRLNFGAEYIFAGINVPDTFRASFGMFVEF